MTTIGAALKAHAKRLDSRLDAELLLAHALDKPRAWLYAHAEEAIPQQLHARATDLFERRLAGEPVAYILGLREFYGREFSVGPDVLIPRPETELLVELALERLPAGPCRVLDVGTGSGCIALTLAAERPAWQVTALDRSAAALAVCARNAARLGIARVRCLESDLLSAVAGERFDAIVSNPPYVAASDPHLRRGDLRFEPDLALSAGADGMSVITALIDQAQTALEPGGWLILEHGHEQGPAVAARMREAGLEEPATRQDLAGLDRATLARRCRAAGTMDRNLVCR
ncbi:MAG: peptide chain release factor N(5)-glutamine methyltransferase [Wenzhouxiangella sp.]